MYRIRSVNNGRRLRILVSAEVFLPAINGVTNSVIRVVDHLDEAGHAVCIIAPGPGEPWIRSSSGSKIPVHRVRGVTVPMYRSLRSGVATSRQVNAIIDGFKPDLIHLASPVVLGRTVGSVANRLGVPTVALFQTDLSGFLSEYGLPRAAAPAWGWLRQIHNRADLTLAPTVATSTELGQRGFERVQVWGRGVDHDQFRPGRRDSGFRAQAGATEDHVLVGYVGRLASEKRVDRLRHLERRDDVRLAIIGDGPQRPNLEQVLPHATFTGYLAGEALGQAMASLDIFVHTGEHETFGQTLQEAMASGVPVIAPASGGPLDLVKPGHNGLLYPPGDDAMLRDLVSRLVDDPVERHRLGATGREMVAGRSWRALGDELVQHYRKLVDRRELLAA